MQAVATHPSGIPGAPFRTEPDATLACDAAGRVRVVVTCRTDEDPADARRIAAAAGVMPDLFASAARLVAAYEAWMATVEGSAEDRAALDRWDEIAAVETGVIGALLKHAGIPIAEGAAVATVRSCRLCGCTENRACVDPRDGQPCAWAGPDLCTACAPIAAAAAEQGFRPGGTA